MGALKLNVLHWHITDSQAFPLRTNRTPALANGAYAPSLTYSTSDVRGLVAYATDRGIRVVPELDAPAHAADETLVAQPAAGHGRSA